MDKRFLSLTYTQVMVFLICLDELKEKNPQFYDELSESFVLDTINKIPIARKFLVSESMVGYLTRLTGVNPLDKEVVKSYKPIIKNVFEESKAEFERNLRR